MLWPSLLTTEPLKRSTIFNARKSRNITNYRDQLANPICPNDIKTHYDFKLTYVSFSCTTTSGFPRIILPEAQVLKVNETHFIPSHRSVIKNPAYALTCRPAHVSCMQSIERHVGHFPSAIINSKWLRRAVVRGWTKVNAGDEAGKKKEAFPSNRGDDIRHLVFVIYISTTLNSTPPSSESRAGTIFLAFNFCAWVWLFPYFTECTGLAPGRGKRSLTLSSSSGIGITSSLCCRKHFISWSLVCQLLYM